MPSFGPWVIFFPEIIDTCVIFGQHFRPRCFLSKVKFMIYLLISALTQWPSHTGCVILGLRSDVGLIEIKAVQSGKHQGKWKQIITRAAGWEILTRRQLAENFKRKKKDFFQMPELVRASWIHIRLAIETPLPSGGAPAKQTNRSGDPRQKTPGTG